MSSFVDSQYGPVPGVLPGIRDSHFAGRWICCQSGNKEIYMEPYKYFNNFIEMPVVLIVFLVGVVLVLFGIGKTLLKKTFDKGIWFVGIGTVLTVLALLLTAGYNNTAYYPSNTDIQSSLTLANSCSSQFTLKTMAYVSILVPFVIAYIFYAWRSIDNRKIDAKEMDEGGHAY